MKAYFENHAQGLAHCPSAGLGEDADDLPVLAVCKAFCGSVHERLWCCVVR